MEKENQKIKKQGPMYRIKYLLSLTLSLLAVFVSQAQILTTNNTSSLTIQAGTTFSAGGLTLIPANHFTFKEGNGIIRDTGVAHPASKALIERAYLFTKATTPYQGMIHFNYHDSDLNGLNESGLELHVHDGVNWKPHTASKHDHQQNMHSSLLSGVNLFKLTLVDRKSLISKREPLPVHVLTNPVITGQISLLVEKDCELVLVNSTGQSIMQKKLSRGWHTWDVGHYPNGTYYLSDSRGLGTAVPIVFR
jgi:hypothetical protein